jgi:hypothetical protein
MPGYGFAPDPPKPQQAQTATPPKPAPPPPPKPPANQGPVAAPGQVELNIPAQITPPQQEPSILENIGNAVAQIPRAISGVAKGIVDIGVGAVSSVLDATAAGATQNRVMMGEIYNPTNNPQVPATTLTPQGIAALEARNEQFASQAQGAADAVIAWGQTATGNINRVTDEILPAPTTKAAEITGTLADVVGRAAPNIGAAVLVGPAAAGAIGAGQVYGSERIGGATAKEAVGPALAAGAAEAIGAKLFNSSGVLSEAVGNTKFLPKAIDAIGEGLEENLESILQGQTPTLQEFAYGAAAGAILGPAADSVATSINKSRFDSSLRTDVGRAEGGAFEIEVFSNMPGTDYAYIGGAPSEVVSRPASEGPNATDTFDGTPPSTPPPTSPNSPPSMSGGGVRAVPETNSAPVDTQSVGATETTNNANGPGVDTNNSNGVDSPVRVSESDTLTQVQDMIMPPIILLEDINGTLDEFIASHEPGAAAEPQIDATPEIAPDSQVSAKPDLAPDLTQSIEMDVRPDVQIQPQPESDINISEQIQIRDELRTLPGAPAPEPTITPKPFTITEPITTPDPLPLTEPGETPLEVPQIAQDEVGVGLGIPADRSLDVVTPTVEARTEWGLGLTPQETLETSMQGFNGGFNSIVRGLQSDYAVVQGLEARDQDTPRRSGDSGIFRGAGATGEVFSTKGYQETWGIR